MKIIGISFVLTFFVQFACVADEPTVFPLVGRWHFVDDHGQFRKGGLTDYKFFPDGRLRFIAKDNVSDYSLYTFQPPDHFVIIWNYGDSSPTQRVQLHLDGDVVTLRFSPMNYGAGAAETPQAVSKMRRVKSQ